MALHYGDIYNIYHSYVIKVKLVMKPCSHHMRTASKKLSTKLVL